MTASPCAGCTGICCRMYSVELTVFDIRRLMAGLGLEPMEFCATVDSWPGRCQITPSRINGRSVNITLRQVDGACTFLRDGAEGCSVYAHRPRSCAVYPFRQTGRQTAVPRAALPCPTSWTGWGNTPRWAADLAVLSKEIRRHNDAAAEVNTALGNADLEVHVEALLSRA